MYNTSFANRLNSSSGDKTKDPCYDCRCLGADGLGRNDGDILYAESSMIDKQVTQEMHHLGSEVWMHTKPPSHFGLSTPTVTARRIDVVRAQLDSKVLPQRTKIAHKKRHV